MYYYYYNYVPGARIGLKAFIPGSTDVRAGWCWMEGKVPVARVTWSPKTQINDVDEDCMGFPTGGSYWMDMSCGTGTTQEFTTLCEVVTGKSVEKPAWEPQSAAAGQRSTTDALPRVVYDTV